ncbi:hypothetical protein OHR68_13530 [Spirillospora sp. NBC_00431]
MADHLHITTALVRERVAILTAAGELSHRTSQTLVEHATTPRQGRPPEPDPRPDSGAIQ